MRVVILQKYLAPYRVPLFNRIASHPDVELHLLYYGSIEERRKWRDCANRLFAETRSRVVSRRLSYEFNFDLPVTLIRDLVRIRPDVVICALDLGGLATCIYKTARPARMVVWSEAIATGEQDRDPARVLFRRLIASRADGFIVPGRLAHGYIRAFSPDGPVCFANNSVEEERIALGLKETVVKFMEEEKIATFSGSLIERKGVHLLLQAFKELFDEIPELRRRWKLRLLGAGPMDVSGFSDPNIVFEGFCEGEDYAARMRQSHVFVLPSLHDPNPLTVIEALFAGNVIIVSNRVGNYPEAVCGNGLVIGWNSVEDIKKSLRTVFRLNNIELARMAARSLGQAKAFTTARSAAGFFSAIGCRRIESSLGPPCLEERTAVNG